MRARSIAGSVLLCCLTWPFLTACDEGKQAKRDDLEAAGAAMLGAGNDDKNKEADAKAAEARRKAFQEKAEKEAAEKAKLDAIAARLVKAGEKPSKNLEAACDSLIVIYEEWIKVVYFDDDGAQLDFFDHKKQNLGVQMAKCAKLQSVPATDCMVEVIEGVMPEDFSEEDAKLLQAHPDYMFDKCIAQFAPEKLE
ncbi:hypothetical protein [Enhygromyxa salina]|uniref:Lipoprotein n=1 Tax=Enhygromyxa salina TaxID=215803 RepID=A0A2S9YKC0_9BACT|nr:hypothetical protein [Enhygromyxa salina]PRQ05550.1 hypothetical protein ENSA7_44400 [Enhygromyxa salina]